MLSKEFFNVLQMSETRRSTKVQTACETSKFVFACSSQSAILVEKFPGAFVHGTIADWENFV